MGLLDNIKENDLIEPYKNIAVRGFISHNWTFITELKYKHKNDLDSFISSVNNNLVVFLNITDPHVESELINNGFEIYEFEIQDGVQEYGLTPWLNNTYDIPFLVS